MNTVLRLLLGVALAALLPGKPPQAQTLSFDQAVVCASGQGLYGWGPRQLAVDAQGNRYVAGTFNGTVALGSTLLTATQAAPNFQFPSDNFLAKLDAAGNYLWAVQMADGQDALVAGLALGAGGDVFVTGSFRSFSARFGANGPVLFNSSAQGEGFVAKLDGTTGQWLWAHRAGGTGHDSFGAVAVNTAGELYVLGQSGSTTADAGPFTLSGPQSFLAKLSSGGTWLWARRTGTGTARANSLLLDAQGDLYLAGGFTAPSATFGATTLTTRGVQGSPHATTGSELFVAKMTEAGAWLWAVQGDAVTNQNLVFLSSLVSDGAGHLFVTGRYLSTAARLGGTVLPNASDQYPPPIGPAPPVLYTNNYKADFSWPGSTPAPAFGTGPCATADQTMSRAAPSPMHGAGSTSAEALWRRLLPDAQTWE